MNNSMSLSVNMSNETFDIADYIAKRLSDRYVSTTQLIVLNIIYIGIFISGIVGNICTCIVIARNRNMHTATNFYLVSLAVSDLLTLIIDPLSQSSNKAWPSELYSIWEAYPWRFGREFCVLKSFVQESTAYASVLTITAFTMERYVAICHPMRFQTFSKLSRSIKVIITVWIIGFCCAVPYALYGQIFYTVFDPNTNEPLEDSLVCNIPYELQDKMRYMFQVSAFVFFLLPMTIILVMYLLIGITLCRSDMVLDNKTCSKSSASDPIKARKSVLKMLVAVVIAFFLCWAPFHSQRLMTLYITLWTPELHKTQTTLFYISGVLYFVSATVNPILYNLMSKKFRQAFKRTLYKCCLHKETNTNTIVFGTNTYKDPTSNTSYSGISRHRILQQTTATIRETALADGNV